MGADGPEGGKEIRKRGHGERSTVAIHRRERAKEPVGYLAEGVARAGGGAGSSL